MRDMREVKCDCDLILGWTHHPPELMSRRRLTHDSTYIESVEEVNLMISLQEAKISRCDGQRKVKVMVKGDYERETV